MEGDKKCQGENHWRECWTIDGKKTCARLAMADEPAKTELEPLPELTMENAHKISTHQAFLILYRQRLEALLELFNTEIQKLKQSTTRIFEVFFRRSKYKRSTSLIPIVGELASRLFGLSTEEDLNILRDNVKRLNTAMNTTLHVQKIQASIANYQKDKIEAISKKISRTVNTMNYLKNEVDRVISDSSLTMVSLDIVIMSLLNLTTDVSKFEFALFELTGGALSYDLVDPSDLKNIPSEIKTHLTFGLHLPVEPEVANLFLYYTKLKVHITEINEQLFAVVTIPLINQQSIFDLYKISTFPINIKETNSFMSITPEAEYMLIDQDRRKYTLANSEDLKECVSFKNLVCQLTLPIYNVKIGSCILDLFLKESQQQDIPNSCDALVGSTKREIFINLRDDLWFFTVPRNTVGTLSCYNNTEKIDPSYRTEILLQDVGTITIKQGCRLVTKETTVQTPLITTSTNVMSPKIINFQGINLSYTIPNMNNEESKISIWPKIEKIKGTMQLAKIKEALDLQIPLFTTEDQRLKYVESQYGLFSPNSWYNIIITIFLVFLISLTIRALLTVNYEKLLRRKTIKNDAIDAQEMHQLNPTAPDDI